MSKRLRIHPRNKGIFPLLQKVKARADYRSANGTTLQMLLLYSTYSFYVSVAFSAGMEGHKSMLTEP